MKSIYLTLSFCVLFLFSCSETSIEQIGGLNLEEEEKVIVNLDFEEGTEGFITNIFGDNIPRRPIITGTSGMNRCGALFKGKAAEFTEWKGYNFKGNDTNFMGLDMGYCKGFYRAVVETDFEIDTPISKNDFTFNFKYYMPGDFTGWMYNQYDLNVYLDAGDAKYSYMAGGDTLNDTLQTFRATINPSGWVEFSEDLLVDLPAGKYKILVEMVGASAAIDDIQIVEKAI